MHQVWFDWPRRGPREVVPYFVQEPWTCKFYASTGRKYLLRLHELVVDVVGEQRLSKQLKPVSLLEQENGDKIRALYIDGYAEIFDSLQDVATEFNSTIQDFQYLEF